MSFILRAVRPANIQAWVAANAAGSLKATGRESWKAYLVAQGAVGQTISALEFSFLSAQPGQTLVDKWAAYASAQSGVKPAEKARNLYK